MDEYEKAYLAGGHVVHREKRTSRSVFRILSALSAVLGVIGALGIVAGIYRGDPEHVVGGLIGAGGLIVLAVAVGVLGITRSVGRTLVTLSEVTLSYGMRDVRIPLSSISTTSLGTFDSSIHDRRAFHRGEIVGPIEHGGGYVRIAWTDATGPRTSLVPSDDPESLRSVIDRVLDRARAGDAPRARVLVETSDAAAPPAALEAPRAERSDRR